MVDGKHPKPHHHPPPLVHAGVWALLQLAASARKFLSLQQLEVSPLRCNHAPSAVSSQCVRHTGPRPIAVAAGREKQVGSVLGGL
ncbi:hypothetical protein P692DRAFT_20827493 [Suillus brevipes Sb2]|nr:hypothetical protein P692DRAFT_20827493 [Suillus brevipes Sb2]